MSKPGQGFTHSRLMPMYIRIFFHFDRQICRNCRWHQWIL